LAIEWKHSSAPLEKRKKKTKTSTVKKGKRGHRKQRKTVPIRGVKERTNTGSSDGEQYDSKIDTGEKDVR